jgi:hypothetical protein
MAYFALSFNPLPDSSPDLCRSLPILADPCAIFGVIFGTISGSI